MADQSQLALLIDELPEPLDEQVRGYVASVRYAIPTILDDILRAREASEHVILSSELRDSFLFFAALHHLWAIVDGQYWVLTNSMRLLERQDIHEVQIGSSVYQRNSSAYAELSSLRSALRESFENLEIGQLVYASSPKQLLQVLLFR